MDQEKRKHENGTYSPRTILSNVVAVLWLGPYFVGILVGWDSMYGLALVPPFAYYAFLQLVFGEFTLLNLD